MTLPRTAAWLAAPALALALGAAPAPARAQPDPTVEAEAHRLFQEGREAIARGDYATGCPKFAESLRLVLRASTLLNLARCEEQAGHLRAALDHWNRGGALLDPGDERLDLARQRAADIEARLPLLTVRFGAGAPPSAEVRVDGALLAPDDLGTPLPMDPGEHLVTLDIPGQPRQELPVDLAERDRKEVLLGAGIAGSLTSAPGSPARAADRGGLPRQTLGLLIGGVGVAALTTAGVTGAIVVARDAEIDRLCASKSCNQEGYDLVQGNRTLLIVNAIAWGVGIAGVGVGTWLLVTGGGDEATVKTKAKAKARAKARAKAPATAIHVAPLPGGGGLWLRRSF